jgi:GNAT superfamily N-acetyltransferase
VGDGAKLEVRRLEPGDDRSEFRSGNIDLDRFFLRYAGQNQFRHHIGTTYIAVDPTGFIAGFVTVAASEIAPESVPAGRRKGWPRHPVPALRMARIATDKRVRGRGVGAVLLRAVFALGARMAEELGCVGVVVDAKPEAVGFYEKLGVIALDEVAGELGDRPRPKPMFLELGQFVTARPR